MKISVIDQESGAERKKGRGIDARFNQLMLCKIEI